MTARHDEVLVTGLGATTPLGGDVASTWAAMLEGRSGVVRLEEEWAEQLTVQIAGRLAVEPTETLERVRARRLDRCEQVALVAAREAWADAGAPEVDPERIAVVVGTGIGGALSLLEQDNILEASGPRKVSPLTIPMLMPNGPAAVVGLEVGARGRVTAPVSACASGAEAIALALDFLRSGRYDVVVAGGSEACVHPITIAGFANMRAMSTRNGEPTRASRPFDKGRDGFVLAEGAGIMVLERAEFARARGARVHAVLAGSGVSADGHDLVQPEPHGRGATRALQLALLDADLVGTDVGHVNAHATSTPLGDIAEGHAIRTAIGDHAVVTAPKSMLGHMLGAAGAVESIATVLALRDGVIPPTLNLDDPDDDIGLDIARVAARHTSLDAAVNDSFGFGGHNVALAFTRA
ncbi:MAG TPA: beta-ketoacyl-[acyl-carrier-protein] synthase family protein [Mycobacteriales bacterium]|nr:beta-ketoacyl-[acyl-carrier-protein] synthase family protein [Mycobacteriales bacterium]